MTLAFVLSVLLNPDLVITPELWSVLAGAVALMAVGFIDDIKEIHWKIQLSAQIAVAVFIFVMGVRIYYVTNPLTGGIWQLDSGLPILLSIILVISWIVLVINAMNWFDGVDGMAGGVALITAVTIFFLSLKAEVNQPPVAILASILEGVFLGFLVYNFNPARVLAGTSGAMFIGLILAALAIFSGTKIATAILVMAIPIIDFMWVIGERIRSKRSIFKPDKNHLHYKLMKIGWSQRKIALFYYSVTIVIAIVALNTRAVGKIITLGASFLIMAIVFVSIDRKISKKEIQEV